MNGGIRFSHLLAVFILLPLADAALLIWVAFQLPNPLQVLFLVIITGIIGASLARSQGARVIRAIQNDLQGGQMPTAHLLSGALVLVGGTLLLTPGIITDLLGFLLMIPGNRRILGDWLKGKLATRFKVQVMPGASGMPGMSAALGGEPPIKDATDAKVLDE